MHDTILESIVLYLNLKMAELWIEQYFLIEFMKGIPSIRRICVAIFICVRQGIRKNIDSISPLCIMLFNVNLVDRYLDIIRNANTDTYIKCIEGILYYQQLVLLPCLLSLGKTSSKVVYVNLYMLCFTCSWQNHIKALWECLCVRIRIQLLKLLKR